MKAKINKIGRPPVYKWQVVKVKPNPKYKYFEVTTKIYRHELIETIRYKDCDYIELYNESDGKLVERIDQ